MGQGHSWPTSELPKLWHIVQQKYGGEKDISLLIQDLMQAEVLITTLSKFNNPVFPSRKASRTWTLTDYHRLNMKVPALALAIPDIITAIKKVATQMGN